MRYRDSKPASVVLPILAVLILSTAIGCQQDDARSYSVTKEAAPERSLPAGHPTMASAGIDWTLPAGWEQRPGSGMRYATLLLEPGDDPIELRVTPLSMAARDPLANVNRWREQLGLPHIGPDELDEAIETFDLDGHQVSLVSIVGPPGGDQAVQQILAAIVPSGERVWFFMIMDDADRLAPYETAFTDFIRTVRAGAPAAVTATPSDEAHAHEGHAHEGHATPTSSGAEGLTWETPEGWRQDPDPGNMRVATFHVSGNGQEATTTITRFPGDVGGTLANVNRWRRQLGLEPIDDLSSQAIEGITIDGHPGGLIDLTGPATDDPGAASRTIVAQLARPSMTWFFKISGPSALLTAEQGNFIRFVQSVRFTGDDID